MERQPFSRPKTTGRGGLFRTKPISDMLAEAGDRESGGLKKTLTGFDLAIFGIGAIIGTGIFVLTGVAAARYAGPGIVMSFVVSGTAAALTALVYAELASMVPVSGSAYTYSYAALGEIVAWIIGWDLILEYIVAAGAVSIGWSSYVVTLLASTGVHLPAWAIAPPGVAPLVGAAEGAGAASGAAAAGGGLGVVNLPAMLIVLLVTVLLVEGTRESKWFSRIIVTVKVAVVLLFLFLGIRFVRPANWVPFMPFGWAGVMRGAAVIFFAYIGFDAVSTAAEEVKRPQRDLPVGIISSLTISTVLYLAVALVLTGMTSYRNLDTASPIATALLTVGIRWGSAVVSVGAIAGLTTVLLVNIFGQSRVFYSMARDGLLPPLFARIHPRLKTPVATTALTGLVVALIGGLLPIGVVAELANIGTLSAFVLVSVGVVVLRHKRPDLPRPFRVPLVPFLPAVAAAFSLYLIANLPPFTWVRFFAWLFIGLIIYFSYGRKASLLGKSVSSKDDATKEGHRGAETRERPEDPGRKGLDQAYGVTVDRSVDELPNDHDRGRHEDGRGDGP